jgi:hypothetical protein
MDTRSRTPVSFVFRILLSIGGQPHRLSELRVLWREVRRFVGEHAGS